MKVTLQATGYAPVTIDVMGEARVSTQMLPGDKRGVRLSLWELKDGNCVVEVTYLTSWEIERPFTRLFDGGNVEVIHEAAKNILPPGAGYPAMPQYESRQLKLLGMLETLTLVALSEVLAEQIE